MSSRAEVRRALVHAQLEVENTDARAIDEAITWTCRALGALFDLQAANAPEASLVSLLTELQDRKPLPDEALIDLLTSGGAK